jgi:hypothetical protein
VDLYRNHDWVGRAVCSWNKTHTSNAIRKTTTTPVCDFRIACHEDMWHGLIGRSIPQHFQRSPLNRGASRGTRKENIRFPLALSGMRPVGLKLEKIINQRAPRFCSTLEAEDRGSEGLPGCEQEARRGFLREPIPWMTSVRVVDNSNHPVPKYVCSASRILRERILGTRER